MLRRTLWQHEPVAFGVAPALWAWLRPTRSLAAAPFVIAGAGLALALTCRLQVAPLAAILVLWMWVRAGLSRALLAGAIVSAATLTLFAAQYRWFGHVLGGFSAMQAVALQPDAHGVTSSLSHQPWIGAAGLLVSPSRGILIFSPVVLLALAGVRRSLSGPRDLGLGWLLAASGALF